MSKLKKEEFNKEFRFRESRKDRGGLVSCVNCVNMVGGTTDEEPAFCEHSDRFKRIKLGVYYGCSWSKGESENVVSKRVCDAYTPKPLPEGVSPPELPKENFILLGTQRKKIFHADPNCPYVVEELRLQTSGDEGATSYRDKANVEVLEWLHLVSGEVVGRELCEMPCCDSKLPYQTCRVDDYKRNVGIKPDGTEERIWVRNGIKPHEKKVEMTIKEAEAVFDLTRFSSPESESGQKYSIHNSISAVSDFLFKNCNALGSRPLSEAVNPVSLHYCAFHVLEDSLVGENSGADSWVYDKRLFDYKKGLEKPLSELSTIPEGLIPCIDTNRVFKGALYHCKNQSGSFSFKGIVRESTNVVLVSKGVRHYLEIGAVHFSDWNHMWGEFGRGFSGLASFDAE